MHIELKVILDLDTIVCLIRTLLYGESEIHAIQCHRAVRKWRENEKMKTKWGENETLRQLWDILETTLRQLGHNFETQTTFFYHLGKLKVIMSLNGNYPD